MRSGSCHCGAVQFELEGDIDLEAIPRIPVDGRAF